MSKEPDKGKQQGNGQPEDPGKPQEQSAQKTPRPRINLPSNPGGRRLSDYVVTPRKSPGKTGANLGDPTLKRLQSARTVLPYPETPESVRLFTLVNTTKQVVTLPNHEIEASVKISDEELRNYSYIAVPSQTADTSNFDYDDVNNYIFYLIIGARYPEPGRNEIQVELLGDHSDWRVDADMKGFRTIEDAKRGDISSIRQATLFLLPFPAFPQEPPQS